MIIGDELRVKYEGYMKHAIAEAQMALESGEVPVGAIAVYQGDIIARGHNRRENDHDPTAHAEIVVMREAAKILGSWRLTEIDLYVTLEPCLMCAGAIVQARLGKLIYGANDPKFGAVGSVTDLIRNPLFPNDIEVLSGILADECSEILTTFFQEKRN